LSQTELPTTEGGFRTVVADPPWPYNDRLPGKGRGAAKHYGLMDVDAISALPVADVAADAAHLYVWTTNGFLGEAIAVCRAWGFDPKTVLTWVKVSRAGNVRIGMGRTFRNATEHAVFGVRGKLPALRRDVPNVFFAERTEHSRKPDRFYEIVRSMSPGPYLELFARRHEPDFVAWGDEAPRSDLG
jgi:N6-adenosine-specific RNA methylase IME4